MNRGAAKRAANGQVPTPSRHRTNLNVAEFRTLMAAHGNATIADIATALQVGDGTVHRALTGGALSGEFIGALTKWLRTLPTADAPRPVVDDFLDPTQRVAA
jgi:hypothetical protein